MDTTGNAVVLGRDDRFGRAAMRLTVAGLMAVLLLGLMATMAEARTVTTTLGQNEFVNACRNGGGTSQRISSRVVQCTTADGTVVTCDFNTSPATCTIPFKPAAQNPLFQPATGGVLDVYEPVDSGPTVGGVEAVQTGGVLVQAEATPTPAPPAEDGGPVITPGRVVSRAVIVEVEDETP